ncbi:MAG: VIT domain-containing protein, partial [Polyangiaceae bacterium]
MRRALGFALVLVALASGCARSAIATSTGASVTTLRSASLAAPVRTAFVGEGSLEAHGETTGQTKLALERLSVTATTTGDVTEMTIEHVFRNDTDEQLEGTFRFPLPEGAMLTGLAMEIDGKLMDGELVPRDKARKIYEQIVDEMRDPALLEWENGQTFKLRVFPIEKKQTKRVVLKVIAPLYRTTDGLFFAYRPPTSNGGLALERVSLTVDGKRIRSADVARAASGEMLIKVADVAPATLVEHTSEGTYVFAHVDPSFGEAPANEAKKGQALIVMCDRSRSMLEARELQTRIASLLLSKLDARDRFAVLTGDVNAHVLGGGLHVPTEAERTAATSFIDASTPDGASDLGKLFAAAAGAATQARTAGLDPVFVYIGDATPTWGETRASELERGANETFGGAPLHLVVLGKSADEATARALTSATRGRMLRPKTEADALRVSEQIVHARTTRRIEDLKLVGGDGVDVPLGVPSTVYEGDDLTIAAFIPKDQQTNALGMKLVGSLDGRPFEKAISLTSATNARDIDKRWAKARIEHLENDGDAHKEEIVKTSLDHGVMSRYTSFLVLESEEAYARMQIARKSKVEADTDAQVTGRDLDGDGDRTASVSPDHLQPGDPEVRIPAPADAQSVVVVFPFGETKNATFESDAHGGSWIARFLVDAHTPDGSYEIVIRITHRDGHVEIMTLPYSVDTQRPNLDVKVRARSNGSFEIRATQTLTQAEIDAQAPDAVGTLDEKRLKLASILTDAKRVEVGTPDGQILSLTHLRLGEFIGTWRPARPVIAREKLRVIAVDRAL